MSYVNKVVVAKFCPPENDWEATAIGRNKHRAYYWLAETILHKVFKGNGQDFREWIEENYPEVKYPTILHFVEAQSYYCELIKLDGIGTYED